MNNQFSYRKITDSQKKFYGKLHSEFGHSFKSVSSESEEHKKLRYTRLLDPIFEYDQSVEFSIHDVGFGLGSLYGYLCENFDQKKI